MGGSRERRAHNPHHSHDPKPNPMPTPTPAAEADDTSETVLHAGTCDVGADRSTQHSAPHPRPRAEAQGPGAGRVSVTVTLSCEYRGLA